MTDVVMPQMGESIVEGTLTKWLKKAGDHVERDEPLFEISTDKVDTEIPSPAAGTLSEVLVEEGKTVGIATVVARIDEGGGAAPAAAQPAEAVAAEPEPKTQPESAPPPPPVAEAAPAAEPADPTGPLSPLVRRMAREYSIDLTKVKGTGAGGRITKQDVEGFIASQQQAQPVPAPPPPPAPAPAAPAPAPPPPAPVQAAPPPLPAAGQAKTRIEPLSTMRIRIAEHMLASRRTSAHVTTIHKVDMTKVARMRDRHKADFQSNYGLSLTYLPFVVRATVVGLRTYPLLNASLEGNNIIHHNEINIGIAVALENGLIVPVIRQADEKNVLGLQRSIVDLATRARSRQLKPDEVQGGTFSITNFGGFGSVIATPIINQPQVAILGVGAVEKTPVVIDDAIAIRSVMYLSLSFDHRLIDGALADQFTAKVKQALENWSEEVL
ncbi:MAG TPA: 2-oxoglutarate dehydrogenase, E2 component, dihydrolipoamide succinyltransferase [Bryobacteraceae bacterium]|nr:2-oxoglutarate dehydrogenase, E2 component, dihydrolipoamide succinyltransferase [Bryobacteraceae bacterium]